MSKFLNCVTTFPFAFDPEVRSSREILMEDEKKVEILFDMSGELRPACAAVAFCFDEKHPAPSRLHLLLHCEGDVPSIVLELKRGRNKMKYRESEVKWADVLVIEDIHPETTEIVLCCWRDENDGKKTKLIIKKK